MAGDDKITTEGRKTNAAQPLNAAKDNDGAERYPSVGRDDSVEAGDQGEARSFDPPAGGPTRQGAGDGSAPSADDLTGPAGDPAEGKR